MQFLEYRAASVRSIKHLFLVSRRIRTRQFQHVVVSVWAKYDDLTVACSVDILTSDDSNRRSVAPLLCGAPVCLLS